MSLVNDSLKFTSRDTQICWIFLLKKNVSSFCNSHFFSAKSIRILYIESAKTVNEMTLNELVKLTTLWTNGPICIVREAAPGPVIFISGSRPIGVQLVVFCCFRIPAVLSDSHRIFKCLNMLFLLSPHRGFIIGFICDLFVTRNHSLMS